MDTAELLRAVETERAAWDRLLARLDESRMTQPGAAGEWSAKDVVAHITWFEREMIGLLQARALVGSELWDLPQDRRNAVIFEQNRHRPLGEVMSDARQVFAQLTTALRSLGDEDLVDPGRFEGMPAEWVPWQIIAGNTYEHYRSHRLALGAWLDRPDGGP